MKTLRIQTIIGLIFLSTSSLNIRTESSVGILKTQIKQYFQYSQALDELITELIDNHAFISKSFLNNAQIKAAKSSKNTFKKMRKIWSIFKKFYAMKTLHQEKKEI